MVVQGRDLAWMEGPGTLAYGTDGVLDMAQTHGRAFGLSIQITFDNDATVGCDLGRMISNVTVRSNRGELINMTGMGFTDMCALGGGLTVTGGDLATDDLAPQRARDAPGGLGPFHDFATEVTADHRVSISTVLELHHQPSDGVSCHIAWSANSAWWGSTTFTTSPSGTLRSIQGIAPEPAPGTVGFDYYLYYRDTGTRHSSVASGTAATGTVPSSIKGARIIWVCWSIRALISADHTTVSPFNTSGTVWSFSKSAVTIGSGRNCMAAAIASFLQDNPVAFQHVQGISMPPSALGDDDLTYSINATGVENRQITLSTMQAVEA